MESRRKIHYTKETLDYLLSKNAEASQNSQNYLETTQLGKISPIQRQNLITWIAETCESQFASKKTCQISIYCVDLFLSQKAINNFSLLELIGLVCISIALKYEESREISPAKILELCQRRFTLEAIIATEVYVLSILDWKIDIVTPVEILHYILEFTCESFESSKITNASQDFIQIALSDYTISRYPPVVIAVSSAICVFHLANYQDFCKDWLMMLESQTSINTTICLTVSTLLKSKTQSLGSF